MQEGWSCAKNSGRSSRNVSQVTAVTMKTTPATESSRRIANLPSEAPI